MASLFAHHFNGSGVTLADLVILFNWWEVMISSGFMGGHVIELGFPVPLSYFIRRIWSCVEIRNMGR